MKSLILIGCALLLLTACGAWAKVPWTQGNGNSTRERRVSTSRQNENATNVNGNASDRETRVQTTTETSSQSPLIAMNAPASFSAALERAMRRRGMRVEEACPHTDPVASRILREYGAIFMASERVRVPPVCMFQNEAEVARFQSEAQPASALIAGTRIELQRAALDALLAAREDAARAGLTISPRGGAEAARRSFQDTVRLWNSRVFPALEYWQGRGRLSAVEAERVRSLPLHEQVAEVLRLEERGIYFSRDFSKSILYSVAAPGASQHISMLALDVAQFDDARVRRIMAAHGWFQTVKSDLPHFTFLGLSESELPAHGLRPITVGSQLFWIPNE